MTATRFKSEARRFLHPVRPAGSHRVGASVDGRGEVGQSRPSPELFQYSAVWSPWRPLPGTPAPPSSTGLWGDAVPFKAGFQMASGLSASAGLTQSPEEQEMLLGSEVVLMLSPKQWSCPDDSGVIVSDSTLRNPQSLPGTPRPQPLGLRLLHGAVRPRVWHGGVLVAAPAQQLSVHEV